MSSSADNSLDNNRARLIGNLVAPVAACSAGIAAFLLFRASLAQSISWGNNSTDSGELAAAVVSGGLAHPTGYPLYLLLGRIATALSSADPSLVLNYFSAVCAALSVAVLAWLAARDDGARATSATLPGWARAFAPAVTGASLTLAGAFWSQAVVTETRALACALMALVVAALWLIDHRPPH
jgi:hypothetical protein